MDLASQPLESAFESLTEWQSDECFVLIAHKNDEISINFGEINLLNQPRTFHSEYAHKIK